MKRNTQLMRLSTRYLFSEVARRKNGFLALHPTAELLSLGIGDTTEPLPPSIASALSTSAARLGTREGYHGYGPEQGMAWLREAISTTFYEGRIRPEEIFISDGAKSDIGRLQNFFGGGIRIAVQDPTYPVYVDGSLIQGVQEIHLMACTPENHFFPDLRTLPPVEVIYFCSPNNPTGAVATYAQLSALVDAARERRALLLFDAAYASYIQDPTLPKTIFAIPGAEAVAIEVNSFSKLAGFTGVRLGWTVIPSSLTYEGGASVREDWQRMTTTLFNGASIIAQYGGRAVLSPEGLLEVGRVVGGYLENARLLKAVLEELGLTVFGGVHAPYLWVSFPGQDSWELFQRFLETAQLITTPGVGFGACGESFLRFTAYGSRAHILRACERLRALKENPFWH